MTELAHRAEEDHVRSTDDKDQPGGPPHEVPPRTRWGWFVLLVVVALGAFELGFKLGKGQLEEFRQNVIMSREWKLPENLAALGELSTQLKLDLREQRELQEKRESVHQMKMDLEKLQKTVATLQQSNNELLAMSAAWTPDTLLVELGGAKQFAPGWFVGVSSINTVTNQAVIRTGDNLNTLDPGTALRYTIDGTQVSITLSKITPSSCEFKVVRQKS